MAGFPERFKAARLRLGLTQEQLGFELDLTKASVSAWENGREAPSFRLLPQIRAILGVSLDELICGEQEARDTVVPGDEPVISTRTEAEAELLRAFRRLPVKRRKALLEMIG
jgi:transcriptional regulator with XRE-family HTH domain